VFIEGTRSGILHDGDLPGPHGFIWGFVGLEYYGLILNRVIAVLLSPRSLVILRADATVIAPHHLSEAWFEPTFYLTARILNRYSPMAMESDELLHIDRANRRMSLNDIATVQFEPKAKWGMGSVPHSGKIFIGTIERREEIILLGNQNGSQIQDRIVKSIAPPNSR